MVSYAATTETVRVTVRPAYLDGKSDVVRGHFTFAYFVRIENVGDAEVQLLRRSWVITDSQGHVQEGEMEGTYLMQRENGDRFRAQIPTFYLRALTN